MNRLAILFFLQEKNTTKKTKKLKETRKKKKKKKKEVVHSTVCAQPHNLRDKSTSSAISLLLLSTDLGL